MAVQTDWSAWAKAYPESKGYQQKASEQRAGLIPSPSGGGTSGGGASGTAITPAPKPVPTDPLGGYSPVYSGGNLLGFQKGDTFLPKETAVNRAGQYQPQNVSPIITTDKYGNKTVTSYSNLSGQGSMNIVKQGQDTYYNVTTGGGRVTNQYAMYPQETVSITTTPAQMLSPRVTKDYVDIPVANQNFGQRVAASTNQLFGWGSPLNVVSTGVGTAKAIQAAALTPTGQKFVQSGNELFGTTPFGSAPLNPLGIAATTGERVISLFGKGVEQVGKEVKGGAEAIGLGKVYLEQPRTMIPQRVTLGGERYTEPSKISIAEASGDIAKIGTQTGAYMVPYLGTTLLTSSTLSGTKKAMDITLSPEERISAGVEAGISGLFLGTSLIPRGTFSKKITLFEEKISVPGKNKMAFEIIPKAKLSSGTDALLSYDITGKGLRGSTGVVRSVESTNFFQRVFGMKPTKIYSGIPYGSIGKAGYKSALGELTGTSMIKGNKISRPITDVQARSLLRFSAPKPVDISFKGVGFAAIKEGAETRVKLVSGNYEMKPIQKTVSGVKTRQFEPFGYNVKQTGIEVFEGKYKSLPTYEKVFLSKGKYPYQKLTQAGKTSELFGQLSATKQMGEVTLFKVKKSIGDSMKVVEPIKYDVYKEMSLSKRLIPTQGKIFPSRSRIIVSQKDFRSVSDIQSPFKVTKISPVSPVTPRRTISDIKFTDQQAKGITQTLQSIYGKPKDVTLFAKTKQASSLITGVIPKVPIIKSVSARAPDLSFVSSKVSSSIYTGKGLYELTSGGILPNEKQLFGITSTPKLNTGQGQKQKPDLFIREIERMKTGEVFRTPSAISFIQTPSERQTPAERQITSPVFATPTRLRTGERLRFGFTGGYGFDKQTVTPTKKTPDWFPKPRSSGPRKIFRNPKKKETGGFTTLFRRKGKFSALGTFGTPQAAISAGKVAARGTLGASLKVKTPQGGYLGFAPGEEFRLGKGSPTTLVQRKGSRLSSLGERKEIQLNRRGGIKIW